MLANGGGGPVIIEKRSEIKPFGEESWQMKPVERRKIRGLL
jgi:hypothetical protein